MAQNAKLYNKNLQAEDNYLRKSYTLSQRSFPVKWNFKTMCSKDFHLLNPFLTSFV
ncbi:hypothetical protein BY458DRAFT_509208 [Sporodiniella umbellata]|nr:hypothetical protein BY458DRAFT_509208 [Sporodiniella umbellata]